MTRWTRFRSRILPWAFLGAAVGFVLSSLLIYFLGDSGLSSYADLDSYRSRLASNVERLSSINGNLAAEQRLAEDDPQTIRILARGIGLYAPGERVIRIRGFSSPSASYEVGDLLRYRIEDRGRTRAFKILGVSLPFFLAGLALLLSLLRERRR